MHYLIGKERRKNSKDTTEGSRIKSKQTRFSSSPLHRASSSTYSLNTNESLKGVGAGSEEGKNSFSNSPLSLQNPSLISHRVHPKSTPNIFGVSGTKDGRDADRSPSTSPKTKMRNSLPQTGLPYNQDRTRTKTLSHRDSTLSTGSTMSTHNTHRDRESLGSISSVRSRTSNSNTPHTAPEVNSFGNKIWSLRVVDMRLLMSISIRDSVFGYVGRCFEFFQYDVVVRYVTLRYLSLYSITFHHISLHYSTVQYSIA